MNSTTKQCPKCNGMGYAIEPFKCKKVECPSCFGTGLVSSSDPPTAGSGPPAVMQPALRSLSALAKVYTRVEAMRDKARLLGDDCAKHGRWPSAAVHSARVSALTDVLMILLEVEHEEPEANNQG
jgi:hypothetical protein